MKKLAIIAVATLAVVITYASCAATAVAGICTFPCGH